MINTSNVYYASFLLNEGLSISAVEMVDSPKYGKTVQFSFRAGDEAIEQKLEKEYRQEKAVTNIRKYIDSLTICRDLMRRVSGRVSSLQRAKGPDIHNPEEALASEGGISRDSKVWSEAGQ